MPRSLKVRNDCIDKVKLAIKQNGFPSQCSLAEEVGFTLTTINNFLTGKPVNYLTFEELCRRLDLPWREIADLDFQVVSSQTRDEKAESPESIDANQDSLPPYPSGAVPLESPFYLERSPIEGQVYQEISKPGALVRIKAPREMGKTSLLLRILDYAKGLGYRTAKLNLEQVEQTVLSDLNQFLRWLCACIARQLQLKPRLDEYWDEDLGSKISCTLYFQDYLLEEIDNPLVLGLDEVNQIFEHPQVAKDFLPLLRSWYEEAKTMPIWQKLRLIVVHSTEIYVPLQLNQSPFNVGLPIQLTNFSLDQVQQLAQRYGLDWTGDEQAKQLMNIVLGHPALVQIALYHLSRGELTLAQLLETAPTSAGIYQCHLQRYLAILEGQQNLATALHTIMSATEPVPLEPIVAYKLSSLGLIERLGDKAIPSCELYRQYFQNQQSRGQSKVFDAFISYGRSDSKAFAMKLNERLKAKGLNVWFDQEDIPLAVDYQQQINDGIEKAHNFIFIIAPHSVNSKYCLKEINLAIAHHKRIIPLLHLEQISRETWQQRNPNKTENDWKEYLAKGLHSSFPNMHPTISKINWIYFRENIDDFEKSLEGLINVIYKHQDYVEKHTQFLVKALDWWRNQKQTHYLLIGEERQEAEKWLKHRFANGQPPCLPTDLQCEFISESTKNANNLMAQVFLSSSEKDHAIKEKIGKSLMREGFTIWTNKTDIKTGIAFENEINQGIEGADNFVFFISPDALRSPYCQQELAHALANNKRIIPLLIQETDLDLMPFGLKKLQFIDLTGSGNNDKYPNGIDKLLKELKGDASYYENQKVLLVKALKWQRQNRNPSMLLRGYNLQHFQAWLKVAKQRKDHPPLPLQEEFITASLNQPKASSLEVFISYSRADSDFARKLNDALIEMGKLTWFDQESIASGEDFQQEIYRGIETSDNFLFIISPQSVNSPYCCSEVEYAQKLNKRIVTVLHQKVAAKDLDPVLATVQWLDFSQQGGDFLTSLAQLVRILDTDRDHVHNHSKWLQKAKEWENSQKNADLLLRGSEFVLAQTWLEKIEQQNKQPPATELQKEFIQASQTALEAAEAAEKRRQEEIMRLQKRLSGYGNDW
jgi:transcriptional regulator with XRE-family HTH domain